MLRRSSRLTGVRLSNHASAGAAADSKKPRATGKESNTTTRPCKKKTKVEGDWCLPRTRETELHAAFQVIGVDEAGRGPLAGPVVCAAAIVPHSIPGIMDSKLLTKEEERERLYKLLVESPEIKWAVAVVDAARIDEINILEATLEGMHMAVSSVMEPHEDSKPACVSRKGCYVVCGTPWQKQPPSSKFYALIDGNRLPKELPCDAETIVKGDSKEYIIAAASILAKVTRDRLMKGYDKLYPVFQLSQHKGYPTAMHMKLIEQHGSSPIHRRSFAPLKHMEFDDNGQIIPTNDDGDK